MAQAHQSDFYRRVDNTVRWILIGSPRQKKWPCRKQGNGINPSCTVISCDSPPYRAILYPTVRATWVILLILPICSSKKFSPAQGMPYLQLIRFILGGCGGSKRAEDQQGRKGLCFGAKCMAALRRAWAWRQLPNIPHTPSRRKDLREATEKTPTTSVPVADGLD